MSGYAVLCVCHFAFRSWGDEVMNTNVDSGARWFALEFCSARYKNVFSYLNTLDASWYCPMKVILRQRAGRNNSYKVTKVPLFPGYLFVYVDFDSLHSSTITRHQHIRRFLSFGKEPVPVDDETIELIKERDSRYSEDSVDAVSEEVSAHTLTAILEVENPELRTQSLINYLSCRNFKAAH